MPSDWNQAIPQAIAHHSEALEWLRLPIRNTGHRRLSTTIDIEAPGKAQPIKGRQQRRSPLNERRRMKRRNAAKGKA